MLYEVITPQAARRLAGELVDQPQIAAHHLGIAEALGGQGHVPHHQGQHRARRITSYNVCYTKLLRTPAEAASVREASPKAPESQEAFLWKVALWSVITSYSIHYTTLYDLASMLSAGLLMGWLTRVARHTLLRQAVGVSMILLALFMLAWSFGYPLAEPAGG